MGGRIRLKRYYSSKLTVVLTLTLTQILTKKAIYIIDIDNLTLTLIPNLKVLNMTETEKERLNGEAKKDEISLAEKLRIKGLADHEVSIIQAKLNMSQADLLAAKVAEANHEKAIADEKAAVKTDTDETEHAQEAMFTAETKVANSTEEEGDTKETEGEEKQLGTLKEEEAHESDGELKEIKNELDAEKTKADEAARQKAKAEADELNDSNAATDAEKQERSAEDKIFNLSSMIVDVSKEETEIAKVALDGDANVAVINNTLQNASNIISVEEFKVEAEAARVARVNARLDLAESKEKQAAKVLAESVAAAKAANQSAANLTVAEENIREQILHVEKNLSHWGDIIHRDNEVLMDKTESEAKANQTLNDLVEKVREAQAAEDLIKKTDDGYTSASFNANETLAAAAATLANISTELESVTDSVNTKNISDMNAKASEQQSLTMKSTAETKEQQSMKIKVSLNLEKVQT